MFFLQYFIKKLKKFVVNMRHTLIKCCQKTLATFIWNVRRKFRIQIRLNNVFFPPFFFCSRPERDRCKRNKLQKRCWYCRQLVSVRLYIWQILLMKLCFVFMCTAGKSWHCETISLVVAIMLINECFRWWNWMMVEKMTTN